MCWLVSFYEFSHEETGEFFQSGFLFLLPYSSEFLVKVFSQKPESFSLTGFLSPIPSILN